jgi:DMSO/TMAO reductase YedYZ molybdopterin-dependent catalytic subunit
MGAVEVFGLPRPFFVNNMNTDDQLNRMGEKAVRRMNRRELLKLTPLLALSAAAIPGVNETLIKRGLAWSDRASEMVFNPRRMAETFSDREVTPLERFPINRYSDYEPANDLADWKLIVEGMVARPGEYSLEQIKGLPKQTQNVRHICIEGWDVIGNFGGARLADFLTLVGTDPAARFVEVSCLDDYYSSYDIASCLHPQTLLCYEMYGQPLGAGHGAPLRIHMPVKLGYKSARHIYSLRVSNVLGKEKGFWEDQGYSWYGGI